MDHTAAPLAFVHGLTQHGIKLGLDSIRTVCEALDHPEQAFESIVVAGTNGKGSVAAMVETGYGPAGSAPVASPRRTSWIWRNDSRSTGRRSIGRP